MRRVRSLLPMLFALSLVLNAAALAQPATPAEDDPPRPWRLQGVEETRDEMAARLLGVLTYTNVTVQFDQTPVRQAIGTLRDKLGITIIGRYSDDRLGHGIDPTTPITLSAESTPALDVLEELIDQCSLGDFQCTWQLRKGFVEIGTKARLSVPAARQRRTYYIADLIVDVPDHPNKRTRREVHALDVVADIVENIEPDAWDYGQDFVPEEFDEPVPAEARETARPAGGETADGGEGKAGGPAETPPPRRYVRPRKIAIIRYWRDVLIIDAPDYIHRQIGGYPDPIRPGGEGTATP